MDRQVSNYLNHDGWMDFQQALLDNPPEEHYARMTWEEYALEITDDLTTKWWNENKDEEN